MKIYLYVQLIYVRTIVVQFAVKTKLLKGIKHQATIKIIKFIINNKLDGVKGFYFIIIVLLQNDIYCEIMYICAY